MIALTRTHTEAQTDRAIQGHMDTHRQTYKHTCSHGWKVTWPLSTPAPWGSVEQWSRRSPEVGVEGAPRRQWGDSLITEGFWGQHELELGSWVQGEAKAPPPVLAPRPPLALGKWETKGQEEPCESWALAGLALARRRGVLECKHSKEGTSEGQAGAQS